MIYTAHCDGSYTTPDGRERSWYTLHLYLNERDSSNDLVGGATTFHGLDSFDGRDAESPIHVYPKIGRVLLFQHRGLLHSGQDVEQGTKYTMRTDLLFTKEADL